MEFAKTNIKRDWSHVVFSEEHRHAIQRRQPRHNFVCAKSVSEIPGHEMERWGLAGNTELAFYQGTLDADSYQNILKNSLLPAAQEWYEDEKGRWELQQDKASCHTAKSTERWLEQHGVAVVERWPTKGDDINPIENLWAILDERLEDKKFKTEKGMKKAIRQLWDELDSSLYSIPDRLRRIRKAKGGSIKAVK